MKAGFIGAGKVGFTLGKYLTENHVTVTGYFSRHTDSAQKAAEFTQSRYYEDLSDIIRDSDTLFLTVPDGAIGEVWDDMRSLPIENKKICHCSGSISSAAFFDAEERGAYRYSIHPLYAISDKYNAYEKLSSAYFTLEGTPGPELEELSELFRSFGNPVLTIKESDKAVYHAAAVMVSNQMAALADMGAELLSRCGFPRRDGEKALAPLILGNAENIARSGPVNALTGPVERNDLPTVVRHLEVLDGEIKNLYIDLTRRLVAVAERKHPDRDYEKMKKELNKR